MFPFQNLQKMWKELAFEEIEAPDELQKERMLGNDKEIKYFCQSISPTDVVLIAPNEIEEQIMSRPVLFPSLFLFPSRSVFVCVHAPACFHDV